MLILNNSKTGISRNIIIGILAILIIGFLIINQLVLKSILGKKNDYKVQYVNKPSQTASTKEKREKEEEPFARKWRDPNRQFYETIFYKGDTQIAGYKAKGDKIYDLKGKIPDGSIKFFNGTNNTTGYETYFKNKLNGESVEYYENGVLKRRANYDNGKLLFEETFYADGIRNRTRDLSDALFMSNEYEIGIGKRYYRNGKLKYEWNITNSARGGYKRAYDKDGSLREEKTYNAAGELIEDKKY